jgi:DNA invertase Pin-like site-specific DNA recombinase
MQTAAIPSAQPLVKTVRMIPVKPEFTEQAKAQQILRVAAYCRVSTKKDEQHMSYEAQKDFYTDKIIKNPEWRYVDTYGDRGITGTIAKKREDFMRMIRDCKKGRIDLIITKSIYRFSRNTVDTINFVRMLKSMGIGIIFELQGLDTRKVTSEFMMTVYAGMGQAEIENLSANVKFGKKRSIEKGNVHISHKSFLGLSKGANGSTEIEPEEAAVVIKIYESFLAGHTYQRIADDLTAAGILTPMKKSVWTASTVQSILKNEKYIGDALLQKTYIANCLTHESKVNNGELPQFYVENNHPAIIDRGVWNQVQEEITRRSGKRKIKEVGTTSEQGKYSSKYALTELLVCGECGTPYRRCTWSKNGNKKIVWRCISRLDYGKKYCKESPSLEESVLQDAILEAVTKISQTSVTALAMLKQAIGMGLSGVDPDADDPYALQARIYEIEAALTDLYAQQGDDPTGDYESEFEALYGEKRTLKEKLTEIKAADNHTSAERSRLDALFTIVDGIRNHPLEWGEQIVRQMLECVRVTSKDKIAIRFRWGDETEANLTE